MTVVMRLIRSPEVEQRREALADWLAANGIDPKRVAPLWLSIEREADGQTVIRYRHVKTTPEGRHIVDPDDSNRVWTEQRTVPLIVELDLPSAQSLA